MKKRLFLLILTISFTELNAQQEEYTAYLENAMEAVNNKDQHGFTTNMKYFSTAIEENNITPEILTEKNLKLYSECISIAVDKKAIITFSSNDIAFLEYGADRFPENIRILAHGYSNGVWGFPKDFEKAYYWYDKALEKEAMTAEDVMMRIPANYPEDHNNTDSRTLTVNFLEKWADKGLSPAMNKLAQLCCDIVDGLQENEKQTKWLVKARQWYEKAFETGDFYQKAKAANGLSYIHRGNSKKYKQWKKEYLFQLEKYVEDLEQNNSELINIWIKEDPYKELEKRISFEDSLQELAIGYEYEIKDKKKAKLYKEKACQYGLTTFCEK